jgi:Fe-S-cluster formation regulator IscX/YfhJ
MNDVVASENEDRTEMPDPRTVNYVFPVEIVVVGALTEDDHQEIHERVWNDFGKAWSYQSA